MFCKAVYQIVIIIHFIFTIGSNQLQLFPTGPNFLSDNLPCAGYTPPLLEVAADDDTKGEEEAGRENTGGGEVILYVSTTVGTTGTV